jgi:hypothetical protein
MMAPHLAPRAVFKSSSFRWRLSADAGRLLDLLRALFQGQRFRSPADGEVGGYEVARARPR